MKRIFVLLAILLVFSLCFVSCDDFKTVFDEIQTEKNLREQFNYRLAVKYGLVKENVKPIKFYFEELAEENCEK